VKESGRNENREGERNGERMETTGGVGKKERKKQRDKNIGKKYFICRSFGHIACYCRNMRDIKENRRAEVGRPKFQPSNNKFEVLTSRVMNTDISNKEKEKKKKLLREVIVKIGLKQKDKEEEITVEALLDGGAIGLVIISELARKNKFKKKKLERPIYIRNIDGIFNHEGLIEYIVKVELFYRRYKERKKNRM